MYKYNSHFPFYNEPVGVKKKHKSEYPVVFKEKHEVGVIVSRKIENIMSQVLPM